MGDARYRVSAAEGGADGVVVDAAGCGVDLLVVGGRDMLGRRSSLLVVGWPFWRGLRIGMSLLGGEG